ncbi:interleukin-1 receptor-like 1 [Elgaria multicarinata webbii]|uniref:interleukin-1 receptor-like 1 n=1 Tax=Elgaria multicarinata webbii TaxID=159646 RepID=UPI002FCD0DB8
MDLLLFFLLAAFFPVSESSKTYWNAIEGEAFVVKCPPLDSPMTWRLGDKNISTDTGARVHSSGRDLWFLPATASDSGTYTCATTMYLSNVSKTLKVTIHPREEGICFYEDALYLGRVGSPGSGHIYCPSFYNYENATIFKWYKDCKELHGSRYKTFRDVLAINEANVNDTGNYTCQFTYSYGGRNFTVSATRGFRIANRDCSLVSKRQYNYGGSPLNITCKAWLGNGEQTMAGSSWKYNGGELPEPFVSSSREYMESSGLFTEAILSTSEVKREHLGLNFTCEMFNDMERKRVSVMLSEAQCKGHNNTFLIVAFFFLFTVKIFIAMLYHFFRIDIVLLYRRIFNCIEPKEDGKIYDAYVIYPTNYINGISENNFVGSFVHQVLPDVLENKCGYKLCIYGRDVLPGEDAVDAIEKRIQKSRRVILLLTQCLAKNDCFVYEHQIALYHALIRNNVKVILLEMERIGEYEQLQDSLRHLIHQQGTVQWKTKYMAQPASPDSAFWKHVKYQMPLKRNRAMNT